MNLLVFALVVIVDGEEVSSKQMLFRDLNRCRYFADRIEDRESKVTGYCHPKLVNPKGKVFYD